MYNWITLLYTWNYYNIVNQHAPMLKKNVKEVKSRSLTFIGD